MMDNNFDNLKKFIERIRNISFFERLFSWKKINQQLVDALIDLQKILGNYDSYNDKIQELKTSN